MEACADSDVPAMLCLLDERPERSQNYGGRRIIVAAGLFG